MVFEEMKITCPIRKSIFKSTTEDYLDVGEDDSLKIKRIQS